MGSSYCQLSSEEDGEKDHRLSKEGVKKVVPRVLNFRMERDLLWINVLGIILILVISLFSISFVRIMLGVPFILFFPGYSMVCALFPKKQGLEGIERFAISIGLSIAVVPLLGLVLNYTPFGIRLYPVLVSLFAFTFLLSIAAMIRRKNLTIEERFMPSFSTSVPRWGEMKMTSKVLSAGLIASVIFCGSFVTYFLLTPRVGDNFTEFYVLGPGGNVEGYPTNLTIGENGTVILGIINHEYSEVNYSTVIRIDNEIVSRIDGVKLQHEDRWEQSVTFTPRKAGDNQKLEFLLYTNGKTEPYTTLHIWITVNL